MLVRLRNPRDEHAWNTFVDLYSPLISRYGQRCGLQEVDVQEIVQQVLLQVLRSIRTFEYDPERGRFRNWLGTITVRRIQRHLQKTGRDPHLSGGNGPERFDQLQSTLDPVWMDEFNAQVLESALQRIQPEFSPEVWRAFELVWVGDQPSSEVAEQLHKSPDWVYHAKYAVVRRLREEVEFLASDMPLSLHSAD